MNSESYYGESDDGSSQGRETASENGQSAGRHSTDAHRGRGRHCRSEHQNDQQPWIRLLYMLLYGIALHICGMLMWLMCGVQFVLTLFQGEPNANLLRFSAILTGFIARALDYVSYNTEIRPYPFESWPQDEVMSNSDSSSARSSKAGDFQAFDDALAEHERRTEEGGDAADGNSRT